MEGQAGTPLRRDAQIRRDRLIRAAVDLYATDGFDVALERVAERAGVSRPTLYRNFPDRQSLSVAVLQVHLDELGEQVAAWGDRDDAFLLGLALLSRKTLASQGFEKIVAVHHHAPRHADLFRHGVEAFMTAPLERAKAAGLVRSDFAIGDVHRAILMVAGGGLARHGADVAQSIDSAIALLVRGLAPPPTP